MRTETDSKPRPAEGRFTVRRGPGSLYRRLETLRYLFTRDRAAAWRLLSQPYPGALGVREKVALLRAYARTTNAVRGYHTQAELLTVADRILRRAGQAGLTVVEAGTGKGSSTAKLSLATRLAGGRLLVYDSFRGIPENDERHTNLDGRPVTFRAGAFTGRLASVKRTVEQFGAPEVCTYTKGWFEETLPDFDQPVDVVLLDVDLLSSTVTCLKAFWPRLREGGVLFTQDGHLAAIVALLGDRAFWREELGEEPPRIQGLGRDKFLELRRGAGAKRE